MKDHEGQIKESNSRVKQEREIIWYGTGSMCVL